MSYLAPAAAETRRFRLIVGSIAVAVTLGIGVLFYIQAITLVPKPDPKIIFVESWKSGRTRQDTLDDRGRAAAALAAKLKASRAYIASLPADKRQAAQAEYDRYLAAPAKDRLN